MKKKKEDIFNPAFQDLHLKIRSSEKPNGESDIKQSKPVEAGTEDNQYFLEAMLDVAPLTDERKKIIREKGANIRPPHPAPDDKQEVLSYLNELVKGSIEMDITFSDEYMEGSVKGFSRKLMRRLKRGQFPYQDFIDLHGLTKQEAQIKVREFLLQSHRLGLRCVLIVHGRGLNSPESFPVLKDRLPLWLNRGPIKKIILAFATARPYDGGAGAIYVLLKK
ncbi:MAG: Smr/MutS family protein [Thermodesulfobacteriota bacterium]|nr:Smr/MutS family protein [Thermodesulfobacteriota bacterium]